MVKLRPYQADAVRGLMRMLPSWQTIGVAPTSSGKTVVGAGVVTRWLRKHGGCVLWLAHKEELLQQARDGLVEAGIGKSRVGILSGNETPEPGVQILVASVFMFRSRPVPDNVTLVVTDECHHAVTKSYVRIYEQLPGVPHLGLTATPARLDGRPLKGTFDRLYTIAETRELIIGKYIMESIVYGVPEEKANAIVRGAKAKRDYSTAQLEAMARKRPLLGDIVDEWLRLAKDRSTIVYACNVAHAKSLARRFRRAGVMCEVLFWSTLPEERNRIIEGLRSGRIQMVVNVGILAEGFDCPLVKCIVIARPTMSLVLFRQMCGRGGRPDESGERPLILDHAGNVWRHSLPETPVEWSLDGRPRVGPAPMRRCEVCGAMNALSAKECVQCGTGFGPTAEQAQRDLREREAELERIRMNAAERERLEGILHRIAERRGFGEEWKRAALESAL